MSEFQRLEDWQAPRAGGFVAQGAALASDTMAGARPRRAGVALFVHCLADCQVVPRTILR